MTYLPRDQRGASELGGNALVATGRDQPGPGRGVPRLHGGAGADAGLFCEKSGRCCRPGTRCCRQGLDFAVARRPDAGVRRPGHHHRAPRRRRRHDRHLRPRSTSRWPGPAGDLRSCGTAEHRTTTLAGARRAGSTSRPSSTVRTSHEYPEPALAPRDEAPSPTPADREGAAAGDRHGVRHGRAEPGADRGSSCSSRSVWSLLMSFQDQALVRAGGGGSGLDNLPAAGR